MAVTRDEVRHLGWLSRIELTDDELDRYTGQIEEIIKYLDKLDTVPLLQEQKPITTRKKFSDLRDDTPAEFNFESLGTPYRKDGFVKGPRMT
ncbi:MAG: Asp-tRNA(Asn)/Glu-tRNA(Gln) amidotransferase subunit GatC [Nitrososphaera sp.]